MDARRWSTLWVFATGCLSGAVFIAWRSGDVGGAAPGHVREVESNRSSELAPRPIESPRASEVAKAGSEVEKTVSPAHADDVGADETAIEASNSVADVLARLEADYRQRNAPAPATEPASIAPASTEAPAPPARADVARTLSSAAPQQLPAAPDANSVAASTAKPVASEPAAVAVTAPAQVQALPTQATLVALSAEERPTLPGAEQATTPVVSARDAQDHPGVDDGQQRINAQLQRIATFQQVTVAQQAALEQQLAQIQYLQYYSLATTPRSSLSLGARAAYPVQAPQTPRPPQGRIVDTLPPTFSASDNPWGFQYPTPVW